ncbi:MAG: ATP-grasp domain-containing protein [Chitinophagaceae bacterium]|nr:ATP-grasp domain-containing protein [Oligoflexus sp.]
MHDANTEDALKPSSNARILGILGGGQLAYFLALAARRLGFKIVVLSDDPSHLCQSLTEEPQSELKSSRKLLAEACELIITENENDVAGFLIEISKDMQKKLRPSVDVLTIFADKGRQKQWLAANGIESSQFEMFAAQSQDPVDWLKQQSHNFPRGFVLKWTQGGYDGRGVCFARSAKQKSTERKRLLRFMDKGLQREGEVYAEALVDFSCELSLVATRAESGQIVFYPLVLSRQEGGVCRLVRGPARQFENLQGIEEKAREIAQKIGKESQLTGTYAIEFFLLKDGLLLVNEIAPRVHNSGHFSLNWGSCSQFENHVRAISGQELRSPEADGCFAMLNILGPETYLGHANAPSLQLDGCTLHWYGKSQMRPGRKMGHFNLVAEDPEKLMQRLLILENALESWTNHYVVTKGDANADTNKSSRSYGKRF